MAKVRKNPELPKKKGIFLRKSSKIGDIRRFFTPKSGFQDQFRTFWQILTAERKSPGLHEVGAWTLVFQVSIRNSQASYELNGQELFADILQCLFQLPHLFTREVGGLTIDLVAVDTLVEPCA